MKYLSEKLENLTARIESIYFIAAEFCKPSISDDLEYDFDRMSTKEICKIFGWSLERAKDQILNHQNSPDENVLQLAVRNKKEGFLIKCHMPKCWDFYGEKDNPTSWSQNDGHCEIFWIYGDTFGEVVHKVEVENTKRLMSMYQKDKADLVNT